MLIYPIPDSYVTEERSPEVIGQARSIHFPQFPQGNFRFFTWTPVGMFISWPLRKIFFFFFYRPGTSAKCAYAPETQESWE